MRSVAFIAAIACGRAAALQARPPSMSFALIAASAAALQAQPRDCFLLSSFSDGVLARRRKVSVDQLEHRLYIFRRCTARKTLPQLADPRPHADDLARQLLLQFDLIEGANPSLADHRIGRRRSNIGIQ